MFMGVDLTLNSDRFGLRKQKRVTVFCVSCLFLTNRICTFDKSEYPSQYSSIIL